MLIIASNMAIEGISVKIGSMCDVDHFVFLFLLVLKIIPLADVDACLCGHVDRLTSKRREEVMVWAAVSTASPVKRRDEVMVRASDCLAMQWGEDRTGKTT
jgi:hypothetical protein